MSNKSVLGYFVYQDNWEAVIGEVSVKKEPRNVKDSYAVAF